MKILFIPGLWEKLQLTLNNSKPEEGQAVYRIKYKFVQGNESSSYWMWYFISFVVKEPIR